MMEIKQFRYKNKEYIIEHNFGLINVFEQNKDEAICCGFREKLNTEYNNSEEAKDLYKIALKQL